MGINIYPWSAFLGLWSDGPHAGIDYDFGMRRPEPEDICTIMYTSGTTGEDLDLDLVGSSHECIRQRQTATHEWQRHGGASRG